VRGATGQQQGWPHTTTVRRHAARTSRCSLGDLAGGKQRTWPQGMSPASASTRICAKYPSSIDSISIVALSVWMSHRMSPADTLSPTFIFHAAMEPCAYDRSTQ
jgi:hypothetical protein